MSETYQERQSRLAALRQDIKKKRLLFDESKDRFGMEEMSQLMKVNNTSEVKGYPFRVKSEKGETAIKVVPIETKYGKEEHPCHLENIFLKELTTSLVTTNKSPHVTYYLGTQKVSNKSRALKQLNLKKLEVEGRIRSHSNMLISEFVSAGSLDNWIFNTYENDKTISDDQWRTLVFQLLYTIAIMQNDYKMMHNDFHYGNILIDDTLKPGGYFVYKINGKEYYLKNKGVIPKLWDFEFSMAYTAKVPGAFANKFIIGSYQYDKSRHQTIVSDSESCNVPYNYNEVYDVHYFLTSLLDLYISQELFDWIISLYPPELIPSDEPSKSSSSYRGSGSSVSSNTTNSSDASTTNSSDASTTNSSDASASYDMQSELMSDDVEGALLIDHGRMLNGVEKKFDLPTPMQLITSAFFESFSKRPADFVESEAVFFDSGF